MKKRIFALVTCRNRLLMFREVGPQPVLASTDPDILNRLKATFRSARELDLVIAPLVPFDSEYLRIGMAGSYYDRTFVFLRGPESLFRPKLAGVAFACLRSEKIPVNPWDIVLCPVIGAVKLISSSLQQPPPRRTR